MLFPGHPVGGLPKPLWSVIVPAVIDQPSARLPLRRLSQVGVLSLAAAFPTVGLAQSATNQPGAAPAASEPTDTLDDKLISEIELRQPAPSKPGEPAIFQPLDATLQQLVLNQLRTRVGGPYSRSQVTEDITRINRLARFRQADARVMRLNDGSVKLIFTLVPQAIIADVQISGNKKFTDVEIGKEVDILTGTPIDEWQIDRAARRIESLYRSKGYYLARVKVNRDELAKSGVVLFEITEGERVKVMELRFEGNKAFTKDELRQDLKSKEAWLLDSAPLDEEVISQDVGRLVAFYKNRGYLNVRVDKSILPSPDGREAVVTFVIDEDVPYTLRNVEVTYPELREEFPTEPEARTFAGETGLVQLSDDKKKWFGYKPGPFAIEQVKGLMVIKPGDVYSSDKLDASIKLLQNALGKLGYCGDPDAIDQGSGITYKPVITRRELRDENKPEVDILLTIRGVKRTFKTGEILVTGNDISKTKVVMRPLLIQPDRPLDGTAVDESIKRVENTKLFAPRQTKITLQRPNPWDPDYRDVLVNVEQTNTGSLSFGGAVGSDGGATALISLKQRDFDIADVPDTWGEFFSGRAFRGAGQSFSLDILPGDRSQTFAVSVTEPYFLESDYSLGGGVYYRARNYREYDEQRYGGRVSVGHRFGERWTASANLRAENAELSDIEASSPVDYFEVQDPHLLTGLGVTLTRNTLNDPYTPSKGTRIELGLEQVGAVGGDFDFTIMRLEHQVFLPLYEDFFGRPTVLSLATKTSYIPQGSESAPVFERFYLGGQSLRGFAFRTVSPRGIRNDTHTLGNEPVGGSFMFSWSTEVKQPIFEELLSVVAFLDTGTVQNRISLSDYRASVGLGIRLNVQQLSPVPLAFDFGIPVAREDGDRSRLFTFFIDIPF